MLIFLELKNVNSYAFAQVERRKNIRSGMNDNNFTLNNKLQKCDQPPFSVPVCIPVMCSKSPSCTFTDSKVCLFLYFETTT